MVLTVQPLTGARPGCKLSATDLDFRAADVLQQVNEAA
jgi:hypothetical protein